MDDAVLLVAHPQDNWIALGAIGGEADLQALVKVESHCVDIGSGNAHRAGKQDQSAARVQGALAVKDAFLPIAVLDDCGALHLHGARGLRSDQDRKGMQLLVTYTRRWRRGRFRRNGRVRERLKL